MLPRGLPAGGRRWECPGRPLAHPAALLGSLAALAATVGDDVRRVLEDPRYQRALPGPEAPLQLPTFSLGPLATLLRILLWTAVAVAAALLVAWAWRRVSGRARDAEVGEAPGPAPLEVPVDRAEALAAAGRYAEAIHTLLLETLLALSRAARLAPSFTSREIVARVPLAPRAREALVGLVQAVELSRFGGAAAGEADYRACLGHFHAFLASHARAAAAPEAA
jgi:hypothetical protein